MCDCRSETEARLLERVTGQLPDGASDLRVDLGGYAFLFGSSDVKIKNVMPINIEYRAPNRKGEMKIKKKTTNMIGNYCMFCGEKYPESDSAQEA